MTILCWIFFLTTHLTLRKTPKRCYPHLRPFRHHCGPSTGRRCTRVTSDQRPQAAKLQGLHHQEMGISRNWGLNEFKIIIDDWSSEASGIMDLKKGNVTIRNPCFNHLKVGAQWTKIGGEDDRKIGILRWETKNIVLTNKKVATWYEYKYRPEKTMSRMPNGSILHYCNPQLVRVASFPFIRISVYWVGGVNPQKLMVNPKKSRFYHGFTMVFLHGFMVQNLRRQLSYHDTTKVPRTCRTSPALWWDGEKQLGNQNATHYQPREHIIYIYIYLLYYIFVLCTWYMNIIYIIIYHIITS